MMVPGGHVSTTEAARCRIPFRTVNRTGTPGHDPGLQRHHLVPRELLNRACFAPLFEAVGRERIGFNDFRRNGILLPSAESAAIRLALPLHRGPHRDYSELVGERMGHIERDWSKLRLRAPEAAVGQASMRIAVLQGALRRSLLGGSRRFRLNRKCPLGTGYNFAELDAMAEALWLGTQETVIPAFAARSTFA